MKVHTFASISLSKEEIFEIIKDHVEKTLKVRVEEIDFDFQNTPDSIEILAANIVINKDDIHILIPKEEIKQLKGKK